VVGVDVDEQGFGTRASYGALDRQAGEGRNRDAASFGADNSECELERHRSAGEPETGSALGATGDRTSEPTGDRTVAPDETGADGRRDGGFLARPERRPRVRDQSVSHS
jgi:hypothetical protein